MKINITQKFSLLAFITVFCSAIYGAEQEQELVIQQEIAQLAQNNDDYRNFIKLYKLEQASNDAWIYEKSLVNLPATDVQNDFIFNFDVVKNSFNTGKTITATIVYTKEGQSWRQQEIWTTAQSSYLTWNNAALAAGIIGTSLTGYGYYNLLQDLQNYEHARKASVITIKITNNIFTMMAQQKLAEVNESVRLNLKEKELIAKQENTDRMMQFYEKMKSKDLKLEKQVRQALAAEQELQSSQN